MEDLIAEQEPGVEEEVEETTEVIDTDDAEQDDVDGDELTDEYSDDAETEEDSEDDPPEEIEIDFGGQKFKVQKSAIPEEVVEGLQATVKSYESGVNKKFEEVAEVRKELKAQTERFSKLQNMQGDMLEQHAKGLALADEIKQLNEVDMTRLREQDPDQWRYVSDLKAEKQAQFHQAVNTVNHLEAKVTEEHSKVVQEQRKQNREKIIKAIPEFETRENEIVDHVVKVFGVPKEQAKAWDENPVAAQMAWRSMKYEEMQAAVKNKTKPKPAPASTTKPAKAKGGKARKDPGNMSPQEYREWYMRQQARKAKRL